MIFGIAGACRSHELRNLEVNNIEDLGKALLVTIPNTKTYTPRSFTITGNYYNICQKYIKLRPLDANNTTSRFFLNYQNGKCTKQVIGINKFGNVPKKIAAFLNLPDTQLYTGHSLRRSSTTILSDTGANLTEIKQHGGWKSSAVAEQYIEDSLNNKIKRGQKIFQSLTTSKTTNMVETVGNFDDETLDNVLSNLPTTAATTSSTVKNLPSSSNTTINNYNNCTFNIHK